MTRPKFLKFPQFILKSKFGKLLESSFGVLPISQLLQSCSRTSALIWNGSLFPKINWAVCNVLVKGETITVLISNFSIWLRACWAWTSPSFVIGASNIIGSGLRGSWTALNADWACRIRKIVMLNISNKLEGVRPFAKHFFRDCKRLWVNFSLHWLLFCKHGALKKHISKASV